MYKPKMWHYQMELPPCNYTKHNKKPKTYWLVRNYFRLNLKYSSEINRTVSNRQLLCCDAVR
jgi:hypothetical protein